jgi:alkanesulfonate monooxygenase SsuD/methylene tetrahydromethanopterin reductase-like flavin-dependent oxidoreductase (luciferase family)
VIGFGIGNERHEFEVVGLGDAVRPDLHREHVEVVRRIWSGETIDHHGPYYDFTSVSVLPTPAGAVPFWYCGNSAAAARRAAEYCDGWLAGRVTLPTIRARVGRLQRLASEAGRGPLPAAVVAITSPARTREEALSKANVPGLLRQTNASATEVRPPSGQFKTVDDLAGLLLAGPPDAIVEQVRAIQAAGCDQVIFDLRMRFGEWDDALGILATEVLPQLRRGDA